MEWTLQHSLSGRRLQALDYTVRYSVDNSGGAATDEIRMRFRFAAMAGRQVDIACSRFMVSSSTACTACIVSTQEETTQGGYYL